MLKTFDYYKQVEDPDIYLCNPDQKPIAVIHATERNITLRFNDLSEFSCVVSEAMNSTRLSNQQTIYESVCTKRLLYIENIGWFQIDTAEESDDGQNKYKSLSCKSLQVTLNNIGVVTEKRIYRLFNPDDPLDEFYNSYDVGSTPSVVGQLYQQLGIKINLSPTEFLPNKDYGQWTIVYISNTLNKVYRTLEEETTFGYDFIKNTVAQAYDAVFEFDFLYHTIKIKTINEVTTKTNIYLSFDNIINELNVKEESEDIVTVLSCNGGNVDITSVNPMGTNYIVDFNYYMQEKTNGNFKEYPWMSKELIELIRSWKVAYDSEKDTYAQRVSELESLWKQKTKLSEIIQHTYLKILDLQTIQDKYAEKEYEGLALAESINIGETSLKQGTIFYNKIFDDKTVIRGYKVAPTATKNDEKKYEFSFPSGIESREDKIQAMIREYMPNEDETTIESAYLYYMDGDNHSYCKLKVNSEVGVSKDKGGVSAKPQVDEEIYITLRDVTFTVKLNGTADIYIYAPNSSEAIVQDSNGVFTYNGNRYQAKLWANGYASIYLFYVSGYERYTMPEYVVGTDGWLALWESREQELKTEAGDIQSLIDEKQVVISGISDECNIQKYIVKNDETGTLYEEFKHYWIEGEFTNENISVSDDSTMDESIELARQLLESGEIELKRVSQPVLACSVNAINFTNLIEFNAFTNQLELGKIITIEKDEDTYYEPALVSIGMSLDDAEEFTLEFSTAFKINDGIDTYADLLKSSSTTSRAVSANWSNLMSYHNNRQDIDQLLNNPLDRSLRASQDNMASQEFIVDTSGILGRKFSDDSHTSFLPQQTRFMNNQLVFTDDAWKSCKVALGRIEYEDGKFAYGLAAEVLIGKLILGESLKLSNDSNTIVLDNAGILISKKNADGNIENVFKATTDGELFVKGRIYATDLELSGDVQIGTGNISGLNSYATTDSLKEYAKTVGSFIKSSDYTHNPNDIYAQKGMIIDLANQIIRSENFAITETGEVYANDLFNNVTAHECNINVGSDVQYLGCIVPMLKIGFSTSFDAWTLMDGCDRIKGGEYEIYVDGEVFRNKVGEANDSDYEFIFNGTEWTLNDLSVSLEDYGISMSDNASPASDDWFKMGYINTLNSALLLYARRVNKDVSAQSVKWEYSIWEGTYQDLKNYVDREHKYPE